MFLHVTELSARYGRIPVLNGIELQVAAGEFVGVLGHNGMGKTTLLRTLMGFVPAQRGRIAFVDAAAGEAHPEIVADAQAREDLATLRHVAEPAPSARVR